nr:hypothetical protein [Tanacetum cinerariifolium]
MPPKRTSTSEAPAMNQAAIRKLVADSVAIALEAQATTMAHTNNPNRNSGLKRTPITRKCTYEKFMSSNLSTSMVQKEPLVSFAGLNGLNWYFLVKIVPRRTK